MSGGRRGGDAPLEYALRRLRAAAMRRIAEEERISGLPWWKKLLRSVRRIARRRRA